MTHPTPEDLILLFGGLRERFILFFVAPVFPQSALFPIGDTLKRRLSCTFPQNSPFFLQALTKIPSTWLRSVKRPWLPSYFLFLFFSA